MIINGKSVVFNLNTHKCDNWIIFMINSYSKCVTLSLKHYLIQLGVINYSGKGLKIYIKEKTFSFPALNITK